MSAEFLNIVIPMAGEGKRFAQAGYKLPKPLIPVHGDTMINVVINNLRPTRPHRFIFICQRSHLEHFDLEDRLRSVTENAEVVAIDKVTEGAACTVLLARELINSDAPLMIANCDQYISYSIDDYLSASNGQKYDGYIMTMSANDKKWSYLRLDSQRNITEVVEKQVVSNEATVGIYNYARGADFVSAAESMIRANDRVNGEFYVAPVYNYMLSTGARVGFLNIGVERDGMYGLGIPDDLEYFNALPSLPIIKTR